MEKEDHHSVPSQTLVLLPKQVKPEKPAISTKRNEETRHLPQNTEQSSFRMTSTYQVICCFAYYVNITLIGNV